jgi:hypothetical protein
VRRENDALEAGFTRVGHSNFMGLVLKFVVDETLINADMRFQPHLACAVSSS